MLIQQTLIQYLLQKKNLCEIFKVLTIWGNINLFIRPQHHEIYEKYFVSKPARSCVAVKEIPKGVLCEIEAIAAINTFGGCKDA